VNQTVCGSSSFWKDHHPDLWKFDQKIDAEFYGSAASVFSVYGNGADAMLGEKGHEFVGEEIIFRGGKIEILPHAVRDGRGDRHCVQVTGVVGDN